jgi:hypothetical protein
MVGSWTDRASHLRGELQRLAGLVKRFRLPGQLALSSSEPEAEPAPAAALAEEPPRLPAKAPVRISS